MKILINGEVVETTDEEEKQIQYLFSTSCYPIDSIRNCWAMLKLEGYNSISNVVQEMMDISLKWNKDISIITNDCIRSVNGSYNNPNQSKILDT